jgi:HEAT repeat protein
MMSAAAPFCALPIPEAADVLPLLEDADPAVRRVALLRIAEFADSQPHFFVDACRDPDAGVRIEAARALAGNTDPAALTALFHLLADEAEIAAAARASLADMQDPAAAPVLLALLAQAQGEAAAALLAALRQLRHPAAIGPALALLEDALPQVRYEAAGVLAWLRDPAALPALAKRLTNDADPLVRKRAAGALSFAAPDHAGIVLPALSAALGGDADWQVREEAAVTLGKLRLLDSLQPLARALAEDSTWEARLKAANALGRLGDARAVPALVAALAHPVSNLRKEAATALGAIGVNHKEAAAALLQTAENDSDIEVRKTARRALEAISATPTK